MPGSYELGYLAGTTAAPLTQCRVPRQRQRRCEQAPRKSMIRSVKRTPFTQSRHPAQRWTSFNLWSTPHGTPLFCFPGKGRTPPNLYGSEPSKTLARTQVLSQSFPHQFLEHFLEKDNQTSLGSVHTSHTLHGRRTYVSDALESTPTENQQNL